MMGPTGVGKTEIARRLARLSGAPFIKVEATKFTEVGYVGRDVESMVRDLMEVGIKMVRDEENARVKAAAESAAESRLLDLLLPGSFGGDRDSTREKLRQQFRLGFMDDKEVEMEVVEQPGQTIDMFAIPGMGTLMVDSVNRVDTPVLQMCVMLSAVCVCGAYLITDILYAIVDPRIKIK